MLLKACLVDEVCLLHFLKHLETEALIVAIGYSFGVVLLLIC
jgi:hypothetical protein